MRAVVVGALAVMGFINLGYYGWGSHEPKALAAGIMCLFVALFLTIRADQ